MEGKNKNVALKKKITFQYLRISSCEFPVDVFICLWCFIPHGKHQFLPIARVSVDFK